MHYRTVLAALAPLCAEALRLASGDASRGADLMAQGRLLQLSSVDRPLASRDASHGVNLTAQERLLQLSSIDRPRVHILSMGRVGSCFALGIYGACGFKTVYEPLYGMIDGSDVLSPTNARVFDCLYGCQCGGHAVNAKAERVMNEYCRNPSGRLAIKTTRVINCKAYQTYSHPQFLENVKYVVLLRDPRGVWESVMKYPKWAIHSIPLICSILHMQLQTLPHLREAVGSSNILVEILEKWSLNVTAFAQRLAAFSGQEPSQRALEKAAKAQAEHGSDRAGKWYDLASAHDIHSIESDPKCSAYMDSMGYRRGSNDYSQVTDPSLLSAGDVSLRLPLARADDPPQLSIEELVDRLPEEVVETLMPSKTPSFHTIED